MTLRSLCQFKVCQDGLELIVSPNKFGQSIYGNDPIEEVMLSERPSLYGICIPPENLSLDKCRITYKPSSDLLQPIRIWQNTEYDFALTIPCSKNEFISNAKASGNPVYPFTSLELIGLLSFNSPLACKETPDGYGYVLTGRFNFQEYSGMAHLDIEAPSGSIAFAVEVMTSKLSYENDYIYLIEELSKLHSEIILNLDTPVSTGFDFDYERQISPHALLLHIRRLFNDDELPCSIATILNNPNFRFETVVEKEMAAFVTKPCLASLASKSFQHNWIIGGPLGDNFCGFTPETMPSRETKPNFNTVENQFVKAFLSRLSYIIEDLMEAIPRKYTSSHTNLSKWQSQLLQWKSHPFWEGVSGVRIAPNSMILMKRDGYRELYLSCLSFDVSLKFEHKSSESARDGQLKPVWALYQLWCYSQLHDIVQAIAGVPGIPGLESVFNSELFNLSIKEGIDGLVSFKFNNTENNLVVMNIYYNRTFTRTKLANDWAEVYSGFYHPDFSVEIIYDKHSHWLHFDAKYKLDKKQWQQELSEEDSILINGNSCKPEHTNLDKMHSYRDAILGTRGSYILFPAKGHSQLIYVRHADPEYRSKNPGPSIGAFPLRPSRKKLSLTLQKDNIKKQIFFFLNHIYKSSEYIEEKGFK